MGIFDGQFYPTPKELANKMVDLVEGCPEYVLEPSAGKGDLIDAYCDKKSRNYRNPKDCFSAIEINPELRSTLEGKGVAVLDSDFLGFCGPDKFDLIIMNPPFVTGAEHLLKAINMMYNGQIICLLNAETIRNQNSFARKELVNKLTTLDAGIEFIQGAFKDAERKTGVEVALVNITIKNSVEVDLFAGCENACDFDEEVREKGELTTGHQIEELVAEYNEVVQKAIETIVGYYRNYRKVGKYIGLNEASRDLRRANLTELMQDTCNKTVRSIRKDFWQRTLDLPEVKNRMTRKRLEEFSESIKRQTKMDFTDSNIRNFLINLISCYSDTLTAAVLEVFDKFSIKHAWDEDLKNDNIWLFNGWKTNNAFKVGKKVVMPCYGSYGGPFWDAMFGRWSLNYQVERELGDIDIVMNYFDGMKSGYLTISQALKAAFKRGESRNIESEYFIITVYKKGTIHLTFKNEDILRRFNVAACIGKGWLPMDYGNKHYRDMSPEERAVVDSFDGRKTYENNVGKPLWSIGLKDNLMLTE